MSDQIFVQARLTGVEPFLLAAMGEADFTGRSHYSMLITEVLPRALLQELGLSRMLLGASGGGHFLLLLPGEARERAEEFLTVARLDIRALTRDQLDLQWAITENLGDWTDVRKRLIDALQRADSTPAAVQPGNLFAPFSPAEDSSTEQPDEYFSTLSGSLRTARNIGWSPNQPGRIQAGEGTRIFTFEELGVALHIAPEDDETQPASTSTTAARAKGRRQWGVLRGRIDDFPVRVRRAQTIEEHLVTVALYKQFLAGELALASVMGDHWRKLTLLYAGREDFALFGAWDALIGLAREIQRTFQRLAEETLREYPGPEGKTFTMALALADEGASLAGVYRQAGDDLATASASDKDCFYLFGRVIEWKQMSGAVELKDDLVKLVDESGRAAEVLQELISFYREPPALPGFQRRGNRLERPWRFHRRLNLIFGEPRHRGQRKLRTSVLTDLIGKNAAHARLRPTGRVALEWAMMEES